jgi:taurine dioxygenase
MGQDTKKSTHPIIAGFVGEVTGIDLASGIDAATKALLTQAHRDFPVLAIRDQSLDPKALMAFGEVFGGFDIDHHVPQYQDKTHPEVVYLTNRDAKGAPDPASAERGAAWHADSTFKEQPCAHTALHALEIPSKGAGTHFANMVRAYDTLPADLKTAIEGRRAKHKFGAGPADGGIIPMTTEQEEIYPPVIHPMVRTDSATGTKALYINPLHVYGIVDMDQSEAAPLLDRLFKHALNPEFQYLHDYRVGDLVIWDQRRTWHKAEAAYSMEESRLLMRVKISAAA